ncbi:MAG: BrnT family toxin [Methylobacter sp.]|nr:BrnT family toxin [Methylobacter sp.]
MKQINWNAEKNQMMMSDRGISFEDVVFALQSGGLLDDLVHPNRDKYPAQRLLVVRVDDYAWLVPYVETDQEIFLKTIISSRKASKQYLRRQHE